MAPFDRVGCSDSSRGSKCLPELHAGQHDEHNDYRHNNRGNNFYRTFWRRLSKLDWNKHNSQRSDRGREYNLLCDDSRGGFSDGDRRTDGWGYRNRRHRPHGRANISHKFAVGLLAVTFFLPAGVKADDDIEGGVTAIARPQAVSTGQATNQAVQINQGGYSKQGYSPGHFCNSPTFTVTPFFLGNEVFPEYMRGQNYGIQATVSMPLDYKMVSLCKELAEKKIEKERLDYALIRALKCAQLIETGFMFHPSSPFAVVCQDVVPIAHEPKTSEVPSQISSEPES